MGSKDSALAVIAEIDVILSTLTKDDVDARLELTRIRDGFKAALQRAHDFDLAFVALVKEPDLAKRTAMAAAIKEKLPGLLREDCSTVAN